MNSISKATCERVVTAFQFGAADKKACGAVAARAYWPQWIKSILAKLFSDQKYTTLDAEKQAFSDTLYDSLNAKGFFNEDLKLRSIIFTDDTFQVGGKEYSWELDIVGKNPECTKVVLIIHAGAKAYSFHIK